MNRSSARLASKPPSPSMTESERQLTDAALLSLARVLANIAAARSVARRVGGSRAA
jgi:hypothetical protein